MTTAGAQQSLTGHHMRENETGDVKEKDGETSCNSSGDRQIGTKQALNRGIWKHHAEAFILQWIENS